METSVWLTRGTVWLALSLYTAAESSRPPPLRRALNTAGSLAFLAHVICAFGFYHHWSHSAAYADTAQQTAALTGWHWGGGLYINYAFALVWLGEVLWSWSAPSLYNKRPAWITGSIRGFFLFMIFNGAVVFVPGPLRWLGILLCLILITSWWPRRCRP